jgi:hypothetical protein
LNWTRSIELFFEGAEDYVGDDMELLIEEQFIEGMLRFINSFSLVDHGKFVTRAYTAYGDQTVKYL